MGISSCSVLLRGVFVARLTWYASMDEGVLAIGMAMVSHSPAKLI